MPVSDPVPFNDSMSGISMAYWARIDNRDDLIEELALAASKDSRVSDAEVILHAYLKWDDDCASHLLGDFVFALYDEKKRQVFCARDHLGVRPLYYYLSPDRFVCATTLSALLDLDGLAIEIDRKWMADYLMGISMSFDRTPYHGINKLPPAHCLTVKAKADRLQQYFRLSDVSSLKLKDSREYVDAYREQLEAAVKCRVATDYPLGSELSGGIDSSTVTAYAARFFNQPPSRFHAFGFASLQREPEYILSVSRALGLPQTHILLPSAGIEGEGFWQRSLEILGYPVEHTTSTFHEPFYRLAATLGIRNLLSGFGGDEFGSTIHGSMALLALMTQRRYRKLYQILPGNNLTRLLRLIKLRLKQMRTRNFTRPEFNPRLYWAYQRRWNNRIVRPEWVDRFSLKERFLDEARFDAGYVDLKKFTIEKRWVPFVPTRLENCTLMAAARRIEYSWPLLDVRLVRLFLSIPAEEHFYRGTGRYLHRRAIESAVPDSVTWKITKDMGNPIYNGHKNTAAHQFTVNALHPLLSEVIDEEKFRVQYAAVCQAESIRSDDLAFGIRRNIRNTVILNLWLKRLLPVNPQTTSQVGTTTP